MYPIPAGFTTDGFTVGINDHLSPTDMSFIGQQYPLASPPTSASPPTPTPTP